MDSDQQWCLVELIWPKTTKFTSATQRYSSPSYSFISICIFLSKTSYFSDMRIVQARQACLRNHLFCIHCKCLSLLPHSEAALGTKLISLISTLILLTPWIVPIQCLTFPSQSLAISERRNLRKFSIATFSIFINLVEKNQLINL